MGASSSSGARPISSGQLVQAFSRDVRCVSFSMVHDLTLQWRDDPNHSRLTEADPAEARCWGAGESATALPPGMAYAPARRPVPLATLKWDRPTPFQLRAPGGLPVYGSCQGGLRSCSCTIASPRRLATPGSLPSARRTSPNTSKWSGDTDGPCCFAIGRGHSRPAALLGATQRHWSNSYLDAYSPSPTVKAHRPGLI
jgi:hypothetical protein